MASPEQPSAERLEECAEVVGELLLMGGLKPLDVRLPEPSIDSAWLDTIEREIFVEAVTKDEIDRTNLHRQWGAWRLVRRLADDNVVSIRWRCERVLPKPLHGRLRRLLNALRGHAPIVPEHSSRSLH